MTWLLIAKVLGSIAVWGFVGGFATLGEIARREGREDWPAPYIFAGLAAPIVAFVMHMMWER